MNDAMGSAARIFAIEDDPHQLELLMLSINALPVPLSVTTATDGANALLQLEQVSAEQFGQSVAVVLLDLRLPRIHGLEVLARAGEMGLTAEVPFIVFTSSDCTAERDQALRLGAREYLVKPLGYRALKSQLAAVYVRWIAPRLALLQGRGADPGALQDPA